MKKITKLNALSIVILLTSLLGSPVVNAEKLTAIQVLEQSDNIRNPGVPFSTQVTLIEYHKGKEANRSVIKVHSKEQKKGGQYRTLVQFLRPKRDTGKLMLRNGNEIWFYDPAAKNSIRMSAQQRLMGQASTGDVMTSNFALDYHAKLMGEAVIKDAARKPHTTYHLRMVAKTNEVAYASADYWVEKGTHHPIKAKFYSKSKRLMKIAYYTNFQHQLGGIRPTQVLIIDGIDTSKVTKLQMSHFKAITIPEAWFQRSYLPRFKGR
ncbi:MAG: outer membrane lipoprotein-sorting protein [Cocleimonas sp.]|nr:outer membrane lipoprotein-sorting protein [Cocleimonas sp.]